jgi:MFS transporter, SP family, arabinose:H+ symporter
MTTSEDTRPNVLQELDHRPATSFYWSLTLLATLGGFLFGYDTSNIGSALNFVPYHLTGFAQGYLVAGASLGAAVGALAAGPLSDRVGRKKLLVADAFIYALGSILSAVTPDAAVLLTARTLIGLAIGADSAIATAYIAEYAPRERRGSLSVLQQWMITVGILFAYLVALVILVVFPHSAGSADWRWMLGLGAVPALLGLVLRTRMPESPRWLMRHGKYEQMRDALRVLGVNASVEDVRRTAEQLKPEPGVSRWSPGVRRALIVVCVFFAFQQLTGINVPLYYGPHLLGSLFSGSGPAKVSSTISGVEITSIMTAVNVAATYIAFRLIDRAGRRPLAIGGFAGMAVSALLTAGGLTMLGGTTRIVVVAITLDLFIASFAAGVGGTGWLIQGEVFPTEVRGQAAAIAAAVDWIANFAIVEVFPTWQSGVGLGWVMVSFAALSTMAIVFVFRWLPETKGHSVDEIVKLFEREAKS